MKEMPNDKDNIGVSPSEAFEKVIKVVCEVCEVDEYGLLNKKSMPHPTCRGLVCHALRMMTGMSYTMIVQLVGERGHEYTTAALNTATTKSLQLVSTSYHWQMLWKEIRKRLDIQKSGLDNDEPLEIKIVLPKNAGKKIKINVIEK